MTTYKKLDSISHIHKRPDMYIGTNKIRMTEYEFLWNDSSIQYKPNMMINEGFLRIFLEALSNSVDNFYRSKDGTCPMTKLVVKVNSETGETSVWNDGNHIPIEIHPTEKIYIPELIFGHLLSGSNYDDNEERMTSGRNGLGIKLLNVFSKEFSIECYDPIQQLVYKQKWKNNMSTCSKPSIHERSKKPSGYTKISWIPDFEKFHCSSYDKVHLQLYQKYVLDAGMVMRIPVYWNDEKFYMKQFSDYVKLYMGDSTKQMVHGKFDHVEYCICESFCGTSTISFVNGMITKDGGLHVERFCNELYKQLLTKLSKLKLTAKDLKPYFNIFLNVQVSNPEFSSQSKTKLVGCKNTLHMTIPTKHIQQIMKWNFIEDITELYKMKEMLQLKKSEKKRGFRKIEGLDAANFAGGKRSKDCILILCEGLSAKTYSVQGISKGFDNKKGRDYFGVYPLRGKILNVRNASLKSISDNKEITDIIRCLNLRFNVDYLDETEYETLSYGKVCIVTDADEDGHHICALLLNLFHKMFPSLLERSPPFFSIMMTPIAKIKSKEGVDTFYNDHEYQNVLMTYKESNKKFEVKYYKGLGTSSNEEIRQSFGEKVVQFRKDETTDNQLNMIFHKQRSQDRKTWLLSGRPTDYQNPINEYPITLYLNQELIKYSLEDCKRSIPSLFDGLKVSQRKILFSVFKKNLTPQGKSLKVAQLAGYCAEHSNYHHGEQCLHETIIKMCHDFPGSNNIPYFEKDGQFGSRLYGGKDAANARYIFTKLTPLTRLLFPSDDDCLLSYTLDDGLQVEPDFYVPILPLILINGCTAGIGTGWSCSIPCFHPKDVLSLVRSKLKNEEVSFDITPFYHYFNGEIIKISDQRFQSKGIFSKISHGKQQKYVISELPIGVWTDRYKDELETLQENKRIKSFRNYSTTEKVHFEFQDGPQPLSINHETLKLNTSLLLSNMVLFTVDDKILKFENIEDIFSTYFQVRLDLYEKRKQNLLRVLQEELCVLENKRKFISFVLQRKIQLETMREDELEAFLVRSNFQKMETSFDYLLRIPIRDLTKSKKEMLESSIKTTEDHLDSLQKTSIQTMWLKDLQKFETAYDRLYK